MARRRESLPEFQIDLHGRRPEDALRHLERELHAARVRRLPQVLVLPGRGASGRSGKPILRGMVEEWLRGEAARRLGVRGFERRSRGGALLVRLARNA